MRRSYIRSGLVSSPTSSSPGRPFLIGDFHLQEISRYHDSRPTAYLDEMRCFLWDERELEVDKSTISRALQRVKWSRKRTKRLATQRCEELRRHWYTVKLPQWRPDQLVFLDESAAYERTGMLSGFGRFDEGELMVLLADRKNGWAPIGIPPVVYQLLKRSKR